METRTDIVRRYEVCQPGHGFPHTFKLFRDKSESVRHMFQVATTELQNLLVTYGYLAVFIFVGIESIGIPFPGETMLLIAAIDAGKTHQLSIALVIVAAACGAILGDNIGFLIGRKGGTSCCAAMGGISVSTSAS